MIIEKCRESKSETIKKLNCLVIMKRVQEPWKNNAAPTRIYCFYPNVLICFVIYPICCQLKSLFSTTRQKTGHFYLFSAIYSSSSVFLCSRRRVSERERDIYLPMPLSRAVHFRPYSVLYSSAFSLSLTWHFSPFIDSYFLPLKRPF